MSGFFVCDSDVLPFNRLNFPEQSVNAVVLRFKK